MKTLNQATRTQPCKEQWELMCNTVRAEYLADGFTDPTESITLKAPDCLPYAPNDIDYQLDAAELAQEFTLEELGPELQ